MKLTLLILSFLLISCSSNKSDFESYDEHVWEAMLQFKAGEYDHSLNNFKKAFKILPDENVSDYFYAAAAALHLGKENEAKSLIIQSIIETNASKNYFLNFKEFNQFRDLELFSEIENNYENHIAEFYNNLDHPIIYREIDSLFARDQKVRAAGVSNEEMRQTDSLNINRLIEITREYGWQKKGWLILWHQRGTYGEDNYVWNFFHPFITKEIEKGKMRKDFWAMFEEEKSIINNTEQIYGLYWSQFDEYPIKDIQNVDIRRDSIGHPPLWYMQMVYDIELPSNYKATANNL